MALKDLTAPSAVHQAMDLFDQMGREHFLNEHGFGPARPFKVLRRGQYYDSKAIAGVAHIFQHGRLLEHGQFTGGVQGAAQALAKLGFDVINHPAAHDISTANNSFEVLWNPANYHWDANDFLDMQQQIEAGSSVPFSWSIGVRKKGHRTWSPDIYVLRWV